MGDEVCRDQLPGIQSRAEKGDGLVAGGGVGRGQMKNTPHPYTAHVASGRPLCKGAKTTSEQPQKTCPRTK